MNKNENKQHVCCRSHGWRGYSMDELEQRRAINSVKSDLVKEQLAIAYRTMSTSFMAPVDGKFNMRFNQAMSYAAYGLQFFKYARNIMSLYKSFKSTFSHTSES